MSKSTSLRMRQKFEHCNFMSTRKQKDDCLRERLEQVKNSLPTRTKRTFELATEKGSSNWLTVIPLKELDYDLNKKEFIQVTVRVGNNRHVCDLRMR